jgi:hypothetical protein
MRMQRATMPRILLGVCVALGLAAASTATVVQWLGPTPWPVGRLIENLQRYLQEHPTDPDASYNLGRIHSFAFALQTNSLFAQELKENGFPIPEDVAIQREYRDEPIDPLPTSEELEHHLAEAVRLHRQAIELAPERAPFHLGLAYVLETGALLADHFDTAELLGLPPPEVGDPSASQIRRWIETLGSSDASARAEAENELRDPDLLGQWVSFLSGERNSADPARRAAIARLLTSFWRELAIEEYGRAFGLAIDADRRVKEKPQDMLGVRLELLVSYEAGQSYLRLVRERGVRPVEEPRIQELESLLKELEKIPVPAWVTPIVLSLAPNASLAELLADTAVSFDLDGDLEPELWPWVKPDTGLLVWDPEHRGTITSGRSLFGSASGWFFFPDGYRVMAALDDDGDGWLRGLELAGIGVWFDRDTDGVSDTGEVAPVEALGIAGLETRATGRDGLSLVNPRGLELADGRRLPTYDWVTAPAPVP